MLKISQKNKRKKDNHQNDSVYVHEYNTKGSVQHKFLQSRLDWTNSEGSFIKQKSLTRYSAIQHLTIAIEVIEKLDQISSSAESSDHHRSLAKPINRYERYQWGSHKNKAFSQMLPR